MFNKAKKLLLMGLTTIMLFTLTSCGNDNTDSKKDGAESTPTEAVISPTEAATPTPETLTRAWNEGIDTTDYVSDDEMELAIKFANIDNSALAKVMKKAEAGEDITIVCIGGSITQGTISNGSKDTAVVSKKYYAQYVEDWWKERFPKTNINFVNAGIGATTSYLGVHRVNADVLSYDPDLVIVEFAVNDAGLARGNYTYDNLVRTILKYKTNPSVMLLFMAQTNGSSNQQVQAKIGFSYHLPMLSYANVISDMMKANSFTDKELSGDTVHPSALGHAICGEMFYKYFNDIYANKDSFSDPTAFDIKPVTSEKYTNASILDSKSITPDSLGTFVEENYFWQFPNGWITREGQGEIEFTVTCQNLGLIYYKTTDGKGGKFDIIIDGETVMTLDSDFSGGWGSYAESTEVFSSDAAAEHKVVIKKSADGTGETFGILGLLVSGQ